MSSEVSGERWAVAIECMEEFEDPREMLRAMRQIGYKRPPKWVRDHIDLWLDGKLPPTPVLEPEHRHVLNVVNAYRWMRGKKKFDPQLLSLLNIFEGSGKRSGERRAVTVARLSKEYSKKKKLEKPVNPRSVENVLDGKGRIYTAIRDFRDLGTTETPTKKR